MTAADPLTEAPPAATPEQAAEILRTHWGFDGPLTPLGSERDWNAGAGEVVLKLQNPGDDDAVVEFQNQAMAHIARVDPDLPVMRVVAALDGRTSVAVQLADGRRSLARVFTTMPGRLADPEELDAGSAFEWGATAARVGRALRGFFHPRAGYVIQWDIRRAPRLRAAVHRIEDAEARSVVTTVLDRYDATVLPVIDGLRHQVLHNDLGIGNVLVDDRVRITGIVDFGDMTHTALACDLAVILADVLEGRADLLELSRALIAGYQSVTVLEEGEAFLLGDLVATRLAASVAIAAWRSQLHPFHLSSTHRSPDAGPLRSLALLSDIGLEEARAAFEEMALDTADAGALPYRSIPTSELVRLRRATLGPAPLTYDEPVHLRSGRGVWLHGADGRRYLDAYNNVPVLGHSHPAVAAAVSAQMRRLNTNSRYLHEASVALAQRLLPTHTAPFDRVLLVNSGSEANDVARRIAAFVTGGDGALVTAHAYHGVTEATTELSPEGWPEGFSPARVGLVPAPPSSQATIEAAVAGLTTTLGAAFVDCSFTSDGILGPAPDYVRDLQTATRRAGGLVVADEVQAGYGRTGAHLWSYAACGMEPDLVTLGKPMGNGYPVAAIVGHSRHIDGFITATDYFSTFGGNQGAAVAALAVLQVIEEEGLVARAAAVGAVLRRRLDALAAGHPAIVAVRSWGLLAGVRLSSPAGPVAEALRRRGVLVGTTGPAGDVIKIRPPLVFEEGHADLLVGALADALAAQRAGRE